MKRTFKSRSPPPRRARLALEQQRGAEDGSGSERRTRLDVPVPGGPDDVFVGSLGIGGGVLSQLLRPVRVLQRRQRGRVFSGRRRALGSQREKPRPLLARGRVLAVAVLLQSADAELGFLQQLRQQRLALRPAVLLGSAHADLSPLAARPAAEVVRGRLPDALRRRSQGDEVRRGRRGRGAGGMPRGRVRLADVRLDAAAAFPRRALGRRDVSADGRRDAAGVSVLGEQRQGAFAGARGVRAFDLELGKPRRLHLQLHLVGQRRQSGAAPLPTRPRRAPRRGEPSGFVPVAQASGRLPLLAVGRLPEASGEDASSPDFEGFREKLMFILMPPLNWVFTTAASTMSMASSSVELKRDESSCCESPWELESVSEVRVGSARTASLVSVSTGSRL
ncbi:hypothetical protein EYF80_009954 [Liparis tanakae]|uniref:Uncharacterized protein n=1 Tax=Liparis tanakae TaxID=230148 RepID=A0A4Z2IQ49_9TELE|nr:hypothetical protein EYF80_009954 [Liparis tanakae]